MIVPIAYDKDSGNGGATASEGATPLPDKGRFMRWLLTIFIGVIVLSAALPWLEKLGIGRLPGDLRFTVFGKRISLPFASTVLLSLIFFGVARLL